VALDDADDDVGEVSEGCLPFELTGGWQTRSYSFSGLKAGSIESLFRGVKVDKEAHIETDYLRTSMVAPHPRHRAF
jgi:hypothetical protein